MNTVLILYTSQLTWSQDIENYTFNIFPTSLLLKARPLLKLPLKKKKKKNLVMFVFKPLNANVVLYSFIHQIHTEFLIAWHCVKDSESSYSFGV